MPRKYLGSLRIFFKFDYIIYYHLKIGRRRASVADFHQHIMPENFRTPSFSQSWTSGLGTVKMVSYGTKFLREKTV